MVLNATMAAFWMTLLMNKFTNIVMNDGWVHPLAKPPSSFCQQFVMKYCHDNWKFDENSLDNRQLLRHCKSINHGKKDLQWLTNNVGSTFSSVDIIPRFNNWYWARQLELVILNITFSVVLQDAMHVHEQRERCERDSIEQRRCEERTCVSWRWVWGGEDHLELQGGKATSPMPCSILIFEMSRLT